MNNNCKQLVSFTLIFLFLFSVFIPSTASASENTAKNQDIRIILNGHELSCDQPPIIRNNRTLVPIRVISENLGFDVAWRPFGNNDGNVHCTDGEMSLTLGIWSPYAVFCPGKDADVIYIPMDVSPIIVNNRTLVPIRLIAEAFDMEVDWDSATQSVIINQQKEKQNEYKNACELIKKGDFYNAYYAFDKLGSFKDSEKQALVARLLNFETYGLFDSLAAGEKDPEDIWFLENKHAFKSLYYDEDISDVLINTPEWIVPLGTSSDRFLYFYENGIGESQLFIPQKINKYPFQWQVYDQNLYISGEMLHYDNKEFFKVTNDIYIDYEEYTYEDLGRVTYYDGIDGPTLKYFYPYHQLFIDKNSDVGIGYTAAMKTIRNSQGKRVKTDNNGLYYIY